MLHTKGVVILHSVSDVDHTPHSLALVNDRVGIHIFTVMSSPFQISVNSRWKLI